MSQPASVLAAERLLSPSPATGVHLRGGRLSVVRGGLLRCPGLADARFPPAADDITVLGDAWRSPLTAPRVDALSTGSSANDCCFPEHLLMSAAHHLANPPAGACAKGEDLDLLPI